MGFHFFTVIINKLLVGKLKQLTKIDLNYYLTQYETGNIK